MEQADLFGLFQRVKSVAGLNAANEGAAVLGGIAIAFTVHTQAASKRHRVQVRIKARYFFTEKPPILVLFYLVEMPFSVSHALIAALS